jgi:hypothetical protein
MGRKINIYKSLCRFTVSHFFRTPSAATELVTFLTEQPKFYCILKRSEQLYNLEFTCVLIEDEITALRSIIVPLKGWKSSNILEQI